MEKGIIKNGIGLSPLTEKIYLGKQNTKNRMWVGEKKDITDNFIDVVFAYIEPNKIRTIETENSFGITKNMFLNVPHDNEGIEKAIKYLTKELQSVKPITKKPKAKK